MDPKLKLKPVELIDIGIDKYTKIPVPILNDNVITTFDMENGVPTDTFILEFDANYSNKTFSINLSVDYPINLSFNFGDGIIEMHDVFPTGNLYLIHEYVSAITYTISISGWLEKITELIILPHITTNGGLLSASIRNLKRLDLLDLSKNRLTELDLNGLIYLNRISLDDNYFPNDIVDDLYITADTFLTFNGYLSITGVNNGTPSIYSDNSISNLLLKGWELYYNI